MKDSNLREFLALAQVFTDKASIGGWFLSTKLDGMRAMWDGGLTTGMFCKDVPWANVEKDDRYLAVRLSTGLWSRYGKPVYAPQWFTDALPKVFLDGELWLDNGRFQDVISTVKDLEPGPMWTEMKYCVFDSPPIGSLFRDGEIRNVNFKKTFKDIVPWIVAHPRYSAIKHVPVGTQFVSTYVYLKQIFIDEDSPMCIHPQERLPFMYEKALERIEERLAFVTAQGGEGLMVRADGSCYEPKRTNTLLKIKKYLDSEALVVGYVTGRATDRGSKLLGMMGALVVEWQGKRFELSGFTDEERKLHWSGDTSEVKGRNWAYQNPEAKCPSEIYAIKFPRGTMVTFRYRELTVDGIPREASYMRKKVSE